MKSLENWTEQQKQYIRFLGRGKRDINGTKYSKEKFAELIGIHWTTLYEWQNLPGFMEAVFDWSVKEHIDYLPDMIKAQAAKATGQELYSTDAKGKRKVAKPGDTQAFMALMRQFGLLKSDKIDNSGEIEVTHKYEELSDDELDRAIKARQDSLT